MSVTSGGGRTDHCPTSILVSEWGPVRQSEYVRLKTFDVEADRIAQSDPSVQLRDLYVDSGSDRRVTHTVDAAVSRTTYQIRVASYGDGVSIGERRLHCQSDFCA